MGADNTRPGPNKPPKKEAIADALNIQKPFCAQGAAMSALPWFRLYHRIIDDKKLKLVAFEDRWHFVALCCLKCSGELNEPDFSLRRRQVAIALGLSAPELDEVVRRLQAVKLIDADMCPVSWDKLQFKSDADATAADRQRRKRQKDKALSGVTGASRVTVTNVTPLDTDTDTDTDKREPKGSIARCAKPDDVSDAVWQDFKRHRQRHGGISDRVIAGFRREAEQAGWTLEQAMDESITQGWRGFKADYVKGRQALTRGGSLAEIGDEVRKLYGY